MLMEGVSYRDGTVTVTDECVYLPVLNAYTNTSRYKQSIGRVIQLQATVIYAINTNLKLSLP